MKRRKPPLKARSTPIDVEVFEDLGDGSYRLVFLTIADDGYPSRFDEEVTPEGDVEEWLTAFLSEQQKLRALYNRRAKAKREGKKEPQRRVGVPVDAVRAAVDAKFRGID